MKLNHIREFLLLSSNKNFSKTAEQLYMTQSALSRHISAMEDELGVQLINRSTTTFELTTAGTVAIEGFQKVMHEYHNTLNKLGSLSAKSSGELKLGILYYDVNFYVAQIRNVFRKNFPNVQLKLFSYQPEQAEQALFDGDVDAILTYDPMPAVGDGISTYPFLKTQFYVFFDTEHPFNSKDNILVSDLNNCVLLAPPHPLQISKATQFVPIMLSERHVQPKSVIPITNADEVPVLLKENNAVYISQMINPRAYQDQVAYRLFEPERYHGQIGAAWLTKNKNPLITLLINAIKIAYS